MSAYGSSPYGVLPVDAETSVDFDSTSTFSAATEGQFVTVQGPLTLFSLVDFAGSVVALDQRRGLYSGEVYVFERHFFDEVDEPGVRRVGPVTYVTLTTTDTCELTLGTQPATAAVVDRVYATSGSASMTLGTQPLGINAFSAIPSQTTVYAVEGYVQDSPTTFKALADDRFVESDEAAATPFTAEADSRFVESDESTLIEPLVVNDPGDQSGNEGEEFSDLIDSATFSWPLDDANGSAFATDETGNGNDGEVSSGATPGLGATAISARGGTSYRKTTNTGAIDNNPDLASQTQMTVDVLYQELAQSSNRDIFSVNDQFSGDQVLWRKIDDDLYVIIDGASSINTGIALVADQVYHLLVTIDTSTGDVEAFVDNVSVGTRTGTPADIERVVVSPGTTSSAHGSWAEVGFWPFIFDADQRAQRYAQVAP